VPVGAEPITDEILSASTVGAEAQWNGYRGTGADHRRSVGDSSRILNIRRWNVILGLAKSASRDEVEVIFGNSGSDHSMHDNMSLPTPTPHTARLLLRPFTEADTDSTLREDCIVDGEVSDSWVYGLLRREWKQLQSGSAAG
jgi:hypothetical protein